MLNAGRKRLLVGTVLLGLSTFAASWSVVQRFVGERAERETVVTTIHKLVRGELLQEVRPPQRTDSEAEWTKKRAHVNRLPKAQNRRCRAQRDCERDTPANCV